ncbi:MAG: polyprenyl synthetase family protein [Methanomassiliicoccales archaeon]
MSWDQPIKNELNLVEEEIRRCIHSKQRLLTEISMHVIGAGGKRIRPGVAILSYRAVGGVDVARVVGIAAAFELIHSATLIHDDINDGGTKRRGKISAHRKYGVQLSLVAGDFLFVKGFRAGGSFSKEVVEIIADACSCMAEGEIMQVEHMNDPSTSIETYLKIIEGKTAKPIEASAKVGTLLGGGSAGAIEAFGSYGLNLGMAFQIMDDILDIIGREDSLGKPKGMDFYDGTPTLPIILAMEDGVTGRRLSELFEKKKKRKKEVEEALKIMSGSEAIRLSKEKAVEFSRRAVDSLATLDSSVYIEALRSLANTVVERES